MKLQKRFSDEQLKTILEEAAIYMCACPSQVAEQILKLRAVIRYQENCDQQYDTDSVVHKSIAKSALQAMKIMEDCLDEILDIEGWDRSTMKMPEGLRALRDQVLSEA